MNKLLLISEEPIWDTQVEVLKEDKSDKKNYYISGITIQTDVKNGNGRIYPLGITEKEVNRYITEKIDKRSAFGELDHPATAKINPDRVSHMFESLKRDGKNFISKAKVWDSPMGNIVKVFINENATLGISTRAVGSLKESNGVQIVQDDLHLITAGDIVTEPSAPEAFIKGIREGVEYEWVDNQLVESIIMNVNKKYRSNLTP